MAGPMLDRPLAQAAILYIFTVCRRRRRHHRRTASARSRATRHRVPKTPRAGRSRGAARSGRSSIATRARPARATTTAGARSSRKPPRSGSAPRRRSSKSASSRSCRATTRPTSSFDLSINPYRGCEHGCIYCFARPTHSYLGLSPGLDFETRIIAKVNAAERLREAFAARALPAVADQHRLGHRRLPAGRAQARHHPLR